MSLFRSLLRAVALASTLLGFAAPATAQQQTQDGAWTLLPQHSPDVEAAPAWVRPFRAQALTLNLQVMQNLLATAPLEGTPQAAAAPLFLALPDPTGTLRTFAVAESPIMEPGLAAQFPDIKTYVGQGIDDPTATLRMDLTPQGFHAQVRSGRTAHWWIDPYSQGDALHYTAYTKANLKLLHRFVCDVAEQTPAPDEAANPVQPGFGILTSGPSLRTYRLAVAATGEYTAFHGGTVALGQAAIVTAVNRVTGVYETELAVRMTLVANNSSIVYTNSATDPYTNGNGSTMLGENQNNLTTVIGSANYDIGHVFSTGGGGVAGLGVVCSNTSKARGVTGSGAPTGDAFWIDYVAHEMGHQFGANHAFNGINGSCGGGNRNASTAYEPGSGTTIMNYAGICGVDDFANNSDAYFNFISLQEIRNNVQSGTASLCGTATSTGNGAPSVTAPGINGLTLPKGTPFFLTALGNDPNADPLTYCWEERDQEATGTALSTPDNGAMPLFRSFSPTTSPTRFFPALSKVIAGTSDNTEKLPQLARAAFRFTVTARDNRAAAGGVERADVSMAVTAAAGPFTVTAPSTNTSWAAGSTQTVTWNVAGTTGSGVNCANVAILLSTDGGLTFPITMVASTPNTGSATFTVPNNQTATGRIMVRGVNHVFYNVAAGRVTITAPVNGVVLSGSGANSINDTSGNGNANGRVDPGETSIAVNVPISNTGNQTATSVSGTLSSLSANVSVTTAASTYASLAPGAGASNDSPYVINVSSAHPCGTPVALRLTINSAQGAFTYDFSLSTGTSGGSTTQTISYTGPAVAIPDNLATGATATLPVSGLVGTISDVNFRFDGSACSNAIGSTTVGLDHTYVGDLTITLQSPTGTIVTLVSRPTSGAGNASGNNFCGTIIDDSGATSIQSIGSTGDPYTGTFSPSSALGVLNGQNPNGNWLLKAVDGAAVDTGSIRAFSLIITTSGAPVCDPPVSGTVCPTITGSPAPATLCPGAPASFTVAASGTAPFTYQWRKNTNPIGGANAATYSIASVTAADAGSYDCVVTNGCGNATSNAASLSVNAATSISVGPSPATLCPGAPASFSVTAAGSGTLTYQWRRNATNIGGANSPTYSIPSVSTANAGTYDCIVTGACGSVTSGAANLSLLTSTSISASPSPSTVCIGAPASFSVSAVGSGTLTYQWRKNTSNIGGANSPTYSIAATTANDAASYDCVVTGTCGSATSSAAALTVNAATAITASPSPATVCSGAPASFTVTATGSGTLTYQWRKNTSNIGGANSPTYSIAATTTDDAASYDCIVTGTCGSATSAAASLTINSAPTFSTGPAPAAVCEGGAFSLTVSATGSGTLSYQWRKDSQPIGGATDATFSIAAATAADAGSYDCVVTNLCGSIDSSNASVTVGAGPFIVSPPTNLTVAPGDTAALTVTATGESLIYQWQKDSVNLIDGGPITGALTATLTINPAALEDAGAYTVILTTPCGTTTAGPVTLTVSSFNCPADFNQDGEFTPDDLADYIGCYFGSPPCDRVDYNQDGEYTPDDLADFIGAYFAGC